FKFSFKELQKRIATSLVHKNYPLSSRYLRVRYQLSIIQRTFCLPVSLTASFRQLWSTQASSLYQPFLSLLFSLSLPLPGNPRSFWECKGNRYHSFFQLSGEKKIFSSP